MFYTTQNSWLQNEQKKKKGNKIDNIDQNNNTRAFRSV